MPQFEYSYNSRGPPHNVTWTATVYSQFLDNPLISHLIYRFTVEGIVYGTGEGRTQKAAADAAATQALSELLGQY